MIRHLVLFKLNEGVSKDEPRVAAGARGFAELGAKVPGVLSWETGWNLTDRPVAYDFAINSSVADQAALTAYLEHPEHQAAVAPWQEFATWVVADYEI
ncbi:Stress responsive A/B Barrel Domain [Actinacidiphila alni]|uniref:Stress responsive A/B Barrel Domain n=1 Tax=Actinacidiphila alni TaxID=380248 RepID=A0A1I1ZEV8_9ACTN|nr:Dabb family protein [Actinacidiphila alni]SFE30276.1 Stress responsive A/B Barrel Domain [Actinacidiphila alni]